jgi:hypothetical protein
VEASKKADKGSHKGVYMGTVVSFYKPTQKETEKVFPWLKYRMTEAEWREMCWDHSLRKYADDTPIQVSFYKQNKQRGKYEVRNEG